MARTKNESQKEKTMTKSPSMQKTLDSLAEQMFGRSYSNAKSERKCVTCGGKIEGFRDVLSVKEYSISGMCQSCQDSVFGE
jgi:uncharacterized CHY-type Zn-finger protein